MLWNFNKMRFQKSSLQYVFCHPNTWFLWKKKKSKYIFFPGSQETKSGWIELNESTTEPWLKVPHSSPRSSSMYLRFWVMGRTFFIFLACHWHYTLDGWSSLFVILAFPSLQAARAVNLCFSVAGAIILTGDGCFWRSLLCVAPWYSQTAHFCACPHLPPSVSVELFLESFSRCYWAH